MSTRICSLCCERSGSRDSPCCCPKTLHTSARSDDLPVDSLVASGLPNLGMYCMLCGTTGFTSWTVPGDSLYTGFVGSTLELVGSFDAISQKQAGVACAMCEAGNAIFAIASSSSDLLDVCDPADPSDTTSQPLQSREVSSSCNLNSCVSSRRDLRWLTCIVKSAFGDNRGTLREQGSINRSSDSFMSCWNSKTGKSFTSSPNGCSISAAISSMLHIGNVVMNVTKKGSDWMSSPKNHKQWG